MYHRSFKSKVFQYGYNFGADERMYICSTNSCVFLLVYIHIPFVHLSPKLKHVVFNIVNKSMFFTMLSLVARIEYT